MTKHICSRCGGRKIVDDKECFVCLGKGSIEMTIEELTEYFRRYRRLGDEPPRVES